ncbi:MlaC/ttg2D family ABC transporter substrate-binding protein [Commensalibacter oyaizuii]|uniref:ABC transporter substrate-binding protein n=1 Tax=Commensalibacter oyaizuii TaxID=3043873 RepID=A0ABT6Q1I4_9PROT|nr:ABC transporter substrate-binding protein [Commensalibacter sp. TBRC 16381]MDI2090965.1 ABC transporter substrate-binding protein [Commensalibacter sp. TBRC 16381]
MKLTRFILLCGVTALTGITNQVQAKPVASTSTAAVNAGTVQTQDSPKAPVAILYQALNTIQQRNSGTFEQQDALLKKALISAYDFSTILSNTVGYRYNTLTPADKESLMTAFVNYTTARYISSFAGDTNSKFTIDAKVKPASVGDDKIVSTTIGDKQDPTTISYLVRRTPTGWKIIDVLLNGHISQVAVQHNDFNSTLSQGGSTALVDMLNKKTQSFSSKK